MDLGGSDVSQAFSSPWRAGGQGHTEAHAVHATPKGKGQAGPVGVGGELVKRPQDEDTVLLSAKARLPEEP